MRYTKIANVNNVGAVMIAVFILSCCSAQHKPLKVEGNVSAADYNGGNSYRQMTNFNDQNVNRLKSKLAQSNDSLINIVQLGDSHTAADFFTGELRQRFQQQYGNGGIGFISPLSVPGQRYDNIHLINNRQDWSLETSRKNQRSDFPLAGNVAFPSKINASVALSPEISGNYQLSVLYKADKPSSLTTIAAANSTSGIELAPTGGKWQFSADQQFSLPTTFSIPQGNLLGGWFISSSRQHGVVLSALGTNGAVVDIWKKWSPDWMDTLKQLNPDLVIVAYGTNEAFNPRLDIGKYKESLESKISTIRSRVPNAVILILSPGSSLKNKNAVGCSSMQSPQLTQVIQVQREVASSNKTLFWNWFDYMGGDCSIIKWAASKDAQPDMVHLSQSGYKKSADEFYRQFSNIINLPDK